MAATPVEVENTVGEGLVAISSLTSTATNIAIPLWAAGMKVYTSVLAKYAIDATAAAPSTTVTNQVQTVTITGTPTGGTFTLKERFTNVTTAAINYNASAANVKTALIGTGLPFVTGDITAGGGALPGTAVTLQFTGAFAGYDLPLLVPVSSLTGGTNVAIEVTKSTAFVNPYAYIEAGTQELIPVKTANRFLHIAADSASGVARITWLRG